MRIGIGALVGILGGPATYARALVAALARLGGHEYVVFTDRPALFSELSLETVHVPLATTYHQVTWDHWRLPSLLDAGHVDLYHGTKSVLPWRLGVPAVVTVHDLAVYAQPETFALPQRWHLRLCVPRSVASSARVIADSSHARADLIARFGLPPDRVTAIPLGVGPEFLADPGAEATNGVRKRHGLGERLIACVGTIQPRKRVDRVVAAFVAAGAARAGWELVVAGRCRPGYAPSWLRALPQGVRWLGPLEDAELPALYAAAEVAVSASEYEGFGLSLCEAMAGGCAVVAVDNSAIPEVVGDAGLLVARSDPELLADVLRGLLADPVRRQELGTRARRRAATFTWEETARRTRAVYDEVVG